MQLQANVVNLCRECEYLKQKRFIVLTYRKGDIVFEEKAVKSIERGPAGVVIINPLLFT